MLQGKADHAYTKAKTTKQSVTTISHTSRQTCVECQLTALTNPLNASPLLQVLTINKTTHGFAGRALLSSPAASCTPRAPRLLEWKMSMAFLARAGNMVRVCTAHSGSDISIHCFMAHQNPRPCNRGFR